MHSHGCRRSGGARISTASFARDAHAARATSKWIALPGPLLTYSDDALLTTETCLDGRLLILRYAKPEDSCITMYVSDVATRTRLSNAPCLGNYAGVFGGNPSFFFNGAAYGVVSEATFFSATTSAPLTTPSEFPVGDSSGAEVLGGVRSDVALIQAAGSSYFVSTSTWQPMLAVPRSESFQACGMADDDVWVDARPVVGSWSLLEPGRRSQSTGGSFQSPEARVTLASDQPNGASEASSQLLSRSNKPLVAALATAPST